MLFQRIKDALDNFRHRPFVAKVAETFSTRIAAIILSILTTILTVRTLGAEGRGWLAYAYTVGGIAIVFSSLGMFYSNNYFGAKYPEKRRLLLGNTMVSGIIVSIIAGLVLFLINWLWPKYLQLPGLFLPFITVFVFTQLIITGIQQLMISMSLIRQYNYLELTLRGATLAISAVLFAMGLISPLKYFLANIVAAGFVCLWGIYVVIKELKQKPAFSFDLIKICAAYNLKGYVIGILACLTSMLDVLIIQHYLGPKDTGIYNITLAIRNILIMFGTVVSTLLLPSIVKEANTVYKSLKPVFSYTKKISLMAGILCLITYFCASFVINILFGPEFSPSATALTYSLPGVVIMSAMALLNISVQIGEQPYWYIGDNFVYLGLNVLLNVMFVPKYGINAAAISYSVSSAVFLIITVIYLKSYKSA